MWDLKTVLDVLGNPWSSRFLKKKTVLPNLYFIPVPVSLFMGGAAERTEALGSELESTWVCTFLDYISNLYEHQLPL